MIIDRRTFLTLGGAAAGLAILPRGGPAQERFIKQPGPWRRFEIVTRIDIAKPAGRVHAWVPVPSVDEPEWTKPLGSDWKTNAKFAKLKSAPKSNVAMVYLQWANGEPAPYAEVSSSLVTRDRFTDFSRPRKVTPLTEEERRLYTAPLRKASDDGLIRQTTAKITENAKTDLGKAKAIYEWLADVSACRPKGLTKRFRGRWPDINMLYVRLAHAAGLPARILYGLRVAPSQFGYDCLGVTSEIVTRAQHSRAEVWLEDYGWMPVDPADVCRVVEDEPQAAAPDARIASARLTLFGASEGNWLAYNMANEVILPNYEPPDGEAEALAKQPHTVSSFMYPQAETAAGLLDCRDPDNFKYVITVKELPA